jgi:hypothetical protein
MMTAKLAVVMGTLVASRNVDTMDTTVLHIYETLLIGTGLCVGVSFVVFPQSACWSLKQVYVYQLCNLFMLGNGTCSQ